MFVSIHSIGSNGTAANKTVTNSASAIAIGTTVSNSANSIAMGTGATNTRGNNTERMRITNAGLMPCQDNTYTLDNTTNRWSPVWSANGTIHTADIRLKKNIEPLNYGLKEVLQLQPVSYYRQDNSRQHKIGLIAQEMKKIVLQVVAGNEEEENLGMNYAEPVLVLIKAIKEQQQQQLGALKRQLSDVKK